MKKIAALLMLVLLASCREEERFPDGYGEKRLEIFESCLRLAQVNQDSTHYAPNQKVVSSCSTQSLYLTTSLLLSGYFEETGK